MSTVNRMNTMPTENFTRIPVAALDDPRLSLTALGLLVSMLARRQDGWHFTPEWVADQTPEVCHALRELEDTGYIEAVLP